MMTLDAATPFQRFVLLELAELDAADETPAFDYDVKEMCEARIDDLASEPFGGVTREQVIKALSKLEAGGLIEQATIEGASPVGKGRPAYRLAGDRATLIEALSDDEVLGVLARDLD
jgi:predicted ArsR family transcriptional regulator